MHDQEPELPGASILADEQWAAIASALELTPRCLDVVCGVFDGRSEREIAGRLGVALTTVRTHRRRLYRCLGIHDRSALIVAVMREHLRQLDVGVCPGRPGDPGALVPPRDDKQRAYTSKRARNRAQNRNEGVDTPPPP
ncbi:MAG: helix-turn-helix transcriptional regulator, partial [Phycisphaerales bacterium]|nr:helix-turn-helix transcriptional regulator [Phycisphaerales bacterium]